MWRRQRCRLGFTPSAPSAVALLRFVAKLDSRDANVEHFSRRSGGSLPGFGYGCERECLCGGLQQGDLGSPVRAYSGTFDVFAAKLDSGGALTWNTFLGTGAFDFGAGVALDVSGNVYVGGYSSDLGFTHPRLHRGLDAFAAKLDSGGTLTWNTFLGSASSDFCFGWQWMPVGMSVWRASAMPIEPHLSALSAAANMMPCRKGPKVSKSNTESPTPTPTPTPNFNTPHPHQHQLRLQVFKEAS